MALRTSAAVELHCFKGKTSFKAPPQVSTCYIHLLQERQSNFIILSSKLNQFSLNPPKHLSHKFKAFSRKSSAAKEESLSEDEEDSEEEEKQDSEVMGEEERREWRKKIRDVIDKNSDVNEETDPIEKKKRMEKLLSDYPLVVEDEDPDWPEDADGWGFNLGQFFDKISIKNVKKDDADDDENYDSDKEVVWEDDDYIRPIKEITTAQWEEHVFEEISPLVIFVHNRYKRPKENEEVRQQLEKVAHIFWNTGWPSPRCVAVDAVVETELVSALKVSVFPEVIYTKAGKILYRDKSFRSAEELSKIMGFFYYGAAKPSCLVDVGNSQEMIPEVPSDSG